MARYAMMLLLILAAVPVSGCMRSWLRSWPEQQVPVVFPVPPSRERLIEVVNANALRVQQLQSESATLRIAGFPSLRANLALERPRRFRMRTDIFGLPGTRMDLGSNDELFWMWIEQSRPPAVYYARHDQFAGSQARQLFPIEPNWLIEALGVVYLDPAGYHEGPYLRGPGEMELRSRVPTPDGDVTKITVVHDRYGWVLEQHLYNDRGQLLASSRASDHRHYPVENVTLPHRIDIQLAPGQPREMSFEIEVGGYVINSLYGDPAQLWTMPTPQGYPLVDVADPRFRPPSQASYRLRRY